MAENKNTQLMAPQAQPQGMMGAEANRQLAEVQGSIFLAKQFPRDDNEVWALVERECSRQGLAESAIYAYPKGGKTITGETVILARAMARCYGNLDFGITELEQKKGESHMQAFCWDKERNVREVRSFVIKHQRKAYGDITEITDPRDIYEMTANVGARRERSCILALLPGDLVAQARKWCERTLAGESKETIQDKMRTVVGTFAKIGVTKEMLETRLGHTIESAVWAEVPVLGEIYSSIQQERAQVSDHFEQPEAGGQPTNLREKVRSAAAPKKKKAAPKTETTPAGDVVESETGEVVDAAPELPVDPPVEDWEPGPDLQEQADREAARAIAAQDAKAAEASGSQPTFGDM